MWRWTGLFLSIVSYGRADFRAAVIARPREVVGRAADGSRSYLAVIYVIRSYFLNSVD